MSKGLTTVYLLLLCAALVSFQFTRSSQVDNGPHPAVLSCHTEELNYIPAAQCWERACCHHLLADYLPGCSYFSKLKTQYQHHAHLCGQRALFSIAFPAGTVCRRFHFLKV